MSTSSATTPIHTVGRVPEADHSRIVELRRYSLDVSWRTTWDFVEIVTEDGTVGLGEWSDAGADVFAVPRFDEEARHVLGLTVQEALAHVESSVHEQLNARPGMHPQRRLALTVLSGFDMALCDLAARAAGLPLDRWLSADAGTVGPRCYANINRAVRMRTPDEAGRVARAAVDAGFPAVKIAPFQLLVGSRRLTKGLDIAVAVREAVGDEAGVMLDLHTELTSDELLRFRPLLQGLRLDWLEDVSSLDDLESHRRVRDELGIPLATGEFHARPEELRPLLDAGVVDVAMLDAKHAGGPRRALLLGRAAAQYGVQVSPHNPTGPVAAAHTALLCRAQRDWGILEIAFGETPERGRLVQPAERIEGGRYVLGSVPGLGVGLRDVVTAPWTTSAVVR